LATLVPGIFLAVSALLGPRRPSAIKEQPFECGNVSTGPAWGRFSVKFHLTAILFIVFDVEVVFLYPSRKGGGLVDAKGYYPLCAPHLLLRQAIMIDALLDGASFTGAIVE
jgi:NADH-ubiquinone/plastoquinone oxidoreductase subunit 3